MKIEEIIELFRSLATRDRLEMLLEYAGELPPLPSGLAAERDRGAAMISECQTPAWLWVAVKDNVVRIDADASPESPTVRGFLSLLIDGLNGKTAEDVLATPNDLVNKLGLDQALGMMRMRGLPAIVQRIKRDVLMQTEMQNIQGGN